ncbi:MAG: hypothetical protein DHS20C21_13570 [Gemmatimonadota bacterium]|nr:MAG: hypothetical protein DHS20C21_13570 [Gemmatimonadota bacterium]
MTNQTGVSLKLERTLNAPVDRVFTALTSKAAIAKWFGPSDEMKITVHAWDCKVGGNYRVEFVSPKGDQHIAVGTFREIVPGEKVSYSWAWEGQPPMDTLVTFRVKADGDRTQLTMTHEGFPDQEMCGHHEQGWTGSMERLVRAIA